MDEININEQLDEIIGPFIDFFGMRKNIYVNEIDALLSSKDMKMQAKSSFLLKKGLHKLIVWIWILNSFDINLMASKHFEHILPFVSA